MLLCRCFIIIRLMAIYLSEPLLFACPTAEQIVDAPELWGVPKEAHPPQGTCKPNYNFHTDGKTSIQVLLGRQAFVSRPKIKKHGHFSVFASPEFSVGPVDNPLVIGQNVQHQGYNHCSAVLAWACGCRSYSLVSYHFGLTTCRSSSHPIKQ